MVGADVGVRVVRGPDWRWADQDGGEGHVGTVVEVGRPGSSSTPDRTAVVQWDAGARTNYRVGYQGAFDLRLVDNAPIGVKHANHICDSCKRQGISGMRWKCSRCYDFDLCTTCYMADKHDVAHPFVRVDTLASTSVEVPQRKGSTKVVLQGIFVGAKVIRGPDWDWGNQDGGEGKQGRVTEIRGWDNESGRSVANVVWACGSSNVYRVGHKGKVDLKYIQPAPFGNIYKEHLPVLGRSEGASPDNAQANATIPSAIASNVVSPIIGLGTAPGPMVSSPFSVGERVRVAVGSDELKVMQEGHGGWNHKMTEFINKVGVVHRITDKGDVRVQYECHTNRWTVNPLALCHVTSLAPGDVVTICADPAKVKEYQKGHGEWIEYMKSALGKSGVIAKVYPDGDVRVNVDGKTWTFNPLCLSVSTCRMEYNNTMRAHERHEHTSPLSSVLHQLLDSDTDTGAAHVDQLVREAAQGHLQAVAQLLAAHPEKVDSRSSGKTCLQVACHQGHLDIVRLLLDTGASLEVADDDGDTALHYSSFGNQPEIMELLLRKGASINVVNKGQCCALHVAVNKQHVACVKVLLRSGCDVNVQDSYGDTALHDAIGKESVEILELLGNSPYLDFTLRNKRGFNLLHHAALKGNNFAAEKLVWRSRQFVDVRKDDGFAALHLAALNGHRQVAETLVMSGQAAVDLTNNKRQTPLLLAVSQGHCGVVELLVCHGSDVSSADEDGDTSLHIILTKNSASLSDPSHAPIISQIVDEVTKRGFESPLPLALSCFLVQHGASVTAVNSKGKTPLDLINDTNVIDFLQSHVSQVTGNLARVDMGLRALDLAAESLRCRQPEIAGGGQVVQGGKSRSQPASPARVTGEGSRNNLEPSAECNMAGDCTICLECPATVKFEPCGHWVTCEECAARVKRCLTCQAPVMTKITKDGRIIATKHRPPSVERLKYLEEKIAEIEEAHCCSICMERRRGVAFLCGHGACAVCAQTLKTCHMCRKPIAKKINLY